MKWHVIIIMILVIMILVMEMVIASNHTIVGYEYLDSNSKTHVWVTDGLKKDYYYNGTCLNTISNIGFNSSLWWEETRWGYTHGDNLDELISNYNELSITDCSRNDYTNNLDYVRLKATKIWDLGTEENPKLVGFQKKDVIMNGMNAMNQSFTVGSEESLSVTTYFVLHRTNIRIGGDKENDWIFFDFVNNTMESIDLSSHEGQDIFLSSEIEHTFLMRDNTTQEYIGFRLYYDDPWALIIKDKELYFVFRTGDFDGYKKKTINSHWIDAGPIPGCTPGWNVLDLTTSIIPSGNKNSEDTFLHRASVVISTGDPGGSCTLNYQHKPSTQFILYSTSYPSIFSNSVARMRGGNTNNPLSITSSGSYDKNISCGGKQGSLLLRVVADGSSDSNTISCTDGIKPTVNQISPLNNSQNSFVPMNFSCNATDNTGLQAIRLYGNWSGDWQEEQSQSYGNLVYSATKVFSEELSDIPGNYSYSYACKAEDTRSPNNDVFTSNVSFQYEVKNDAPVMINASVLPVSPLDNDTLRGYCNASDLDGDDIFYDFVWYLNNVSNRTGTSSSYAQGTNANIDNMSTGLSAGDMWVLSCRANDNFSVSSFLNSSEIVVSLSNVAPSLLLFNLSPAILEKDSVVSFNLDCSDDNLNEALIEVITPSGSTNFSQNISQDIMRLDHVASVEGDSFGRGHCIDSFGLINSSNKVPFSVLRQTSGFIPGTEIKETEVLGIERFASTFALITLSSVVLFTMLFIFINNEKNKKKKREKMVSR